MTDKPYRQVLIGKDAIAISNDKKFEGTINDETKSTLTIGTKKLLKNNLMIIKLEGKETKIDGKKIQARPHERLKLR
jgi:RNase P/RNase MRP subunit p29